MATAIHSRKADTLKKRWKICMSDVVKERKWIGLVWQCCCENHLENTFGKGDSQSTREKEVAPTRTNLIVSWLRFRMTVWLRLIIWLNWIEPKDEEMMRICFVVGLRLATRWTEVVDETIAGKHLIVLLTPMMRKMTSRTAGPWEVHQSLLCT